MSWPWCVASYCLSGHRRCCCQARPRGIGAASAPCREQLGTDVLRGLLPAAALRRLHSGEVHSRGNEDGDCRTVRRVWQTVLACPWPLIERNARDRVGKRLQRRGAVPFLWPRLAREEECELRFRAHNASVLQPSQPLQERQGEVVVDPRVENVGVRSPPIGECEAERCEPPVAVNCSAAQVAAVVRISLNAYRARSESRHAVDEIAIPRAELHEALAASERGHMIHCSERRTRWRCIHCGGQDPGAVRRPLCPPV